MVNARCLRHCRIIICASLVTAFLLIMYTAIRLMQLDSNLLNTATNEKLRGNLRSEYSSENTNSDAVTNLKPVLPYVTAICDEECTRFRVFLLQRRNNKPKAAFYYLAQAERLSMLSASLLSVDRYFLKNFDYPVIIFHEGNFGSSLQKLLRTQTLGYRLFFQEVTFTIPHFINASDVSFNISCVSYVSYRHMCRFQAKSVYEEPILAGLEYVWRMDDDSELLSTVQFDVFTFMRDFGLQYGYIKIHYDALACTVGLWKAAERFMRVRHLKPTFFHEWPDPKIYYNNFEVSALPLWLSQDYVDFINYIDHLGGIYYYRWGDAPIKSLAVSMLVPRNETFNFINITYRHGSFYTNGSYSSF
jgi:alpha 1,2-mannosyltransferase